MIERLPDPASASAWCRRQRAAGQRLGFVPTMGALHDGHLALVRRALADNDATCVSIFVNPLQFNNPRDLARYPRDLEQDVAALGQVGCDMVFKGTLAQFFPAAPTADSIRMLPAGPFGTGLEGEHRPGHFDGVRTIVDRLFRTVGECCAYFGAKDFQQTLVIRDLATVLGFPGIVVCPIVREPDGLAMASRNTLLAPLDRARATCLYLALSAARAAWHNGERDAETLRHIMRKVLAPHCDAIEYADLRDPGAWQASSPSGSLQNAQALIAVRIGEVRLIDNMRLDHT